MLPSADGDGTSIPWPLWWIQTFQIQGGFFPPIARSARCSIERANQALGKCLLPLEFTTWQITDLSPTPPPPKVLHYLTERTRWSGIRPLFQLVTLPSPQLQIAFLQYPEGHCCRAILHRVGQGVGDWDESVACCPSLSVLNAFSCESGDMLVMLDGGVSTVESQGTSHSAEYSHVRRKRI